MHFMNLEVFNALGSVHPKKSTTAEVQDLYQSKLQKLNSPANFLPVVGDSDVI